MPKLSEKNCIERDVSWMLFNRRILGGGGCLLVFRTTTGTTGTTGTNGNNGGVASAVPRCSEKNKPG